MTQVEDTSRDMRLDPDSFAQGYFENAVYRHWDPYEDVSEDLLEQDRENMLAQEDQGQEHFDALRGTIALFGAGEEAVTEDLMPLALVLEDIDDQMFVSSQIYEEAKHTQFFDRYWRNVINPVAEERGYEVVNPTDQRWFPEGYVELFDRTEAAMERLLTEDTPENRAKAYCHYHLVVESVLAQTGYYGLTSRFKEEKSDIYADDIETAHLPGLVKGVNFVRSDEGRHVGFGMHKVRHLIHEEGVDEAVVQDTLQSLLPLISETVQANQVEEADPVPLVEYASDKLTRRIDILTDATAEIPGVDELVKLENVDDPAASD
ncbi:ribonucleoside-diphosphate reductase [Halorientalis brevis]|uniref:Ribonucleoside-diphosphate reductase n=1 Tax=Halorientalis brevis TaxID=1126241 RepID=A0ABD6C7J5_9EURY|nr:ribonucleoside-diphosphate reductase [Halorientalis brevis]